MINLSKKYFPNLDFYQKAISYPYVAPSRSFSFVDGQFLYGVKMKINDRFPILSIGSNRSPFQLRNKFTINENLCVVPAFLYNCDIVYSASISPYGSIPATQWPSTGTKVKLNVLWLNKKQLEIMHLTEGIGIAYNFVELEKGSVLMENLDYSGPVYGYVSVKGAYDFNNNIPNRLAYLESNKPTLNGITEFQALNFLRENFGIKNLKNKDWIKKIISDKLYRLKIIKIMQKNSLKPKNPPWKILNIKVKGQNIF